MHEDSLADITTTTINNDVGITHEAPKTGDSVVETSIYIPNAEQQPRLTNSNEIIITKLGSYASTMGETQRKLRGCWVLEERRTGDPHGYL